MNQRDKPTKCKPVESLLKKKRTEGIILQNSWGFRNRKANLLPVLEGLVDVRLEQGLDGVAHGVRVWGVDGTLILSPGLQPCQEEGLPACNPMFSSVLSQHCHVMKQCATMLLIYSSSPDVLGYVDTIGMDNTIIWTPTGQNKAYG